jgi:hypothetical protein
MQIHHRVDDARKHQPVTGGQELMRE